MCSLQTEKKGKFLLFTEASWLTLLEPTVAVMSLNILDLIIKLHTRGLKWFSNGKFFWTVYNSF